MPLPNVQKSSCLWLLFGLFSANENANTFIFWSEEQNNFRIIFCSFDCQSICGRIVHAYSGKRHEIVQGQAPFYLLYMGITRRFLLLMDIIGWFILILVTFTTSFILHLAWIDIHTWPLFGMGKWSRSTELSWSSYDISLPESNSFI